MEVPLVLEVAEAALESLLQLLGIHHRAPNW